MSGAASIAAAKRRRNPPEMTETFQSSVGNLGNVKTNRQVSGSQHPNHIILQHDKQIFLLERKVEKLLDESSNNESNDSSEIDNLVVTMNAEIKLLKTTLAKQQKSLTDLNALVTTLRGTVSSQSTEITELTEQLKNAASLKEDITDGK